MAEQPIKDLLKAAIRSADFHPLFDHFADGVELKVTTSVGPAAFDERRGRQSVIDYLRHVDEASIGRTDDGVDCFARGDRLVALRDEHFTTGEGWLVRSECAVVLDVRDGKITSVAIHRELSPVLGPVAGYADGSSRDTPFNTRPREPMMSA